MKRSLTLAVYLALVGGVAPRASAQFDPYGRPRSRNPGAFDPRSGEDIHWGRPIVPGAGIGPDGVPLNRWRDEKDRDEQPGPVLVPHIPHLPAPEAGPAPNYRVPPEFGPRASEFKMPPLSTSLEGTSASEAASVARWAERGGGGLLAGIGGALAAAFRALFGWRKDERSR